MYENTITAQANECEEYNVKIKAIVKNDILGFI
jgi:hypothetical protein